VLREVVMERAPGEGAVASGEPEAPTPPKRGHLRVVK
jgi:hypothetical protein